jgi:CRP-like cAMP-binding protein
MTGAETETLLRNRLLCALSDDERRRVASVLKLRRLETRDQIYETGEPTREILFPLDCIVSLLTRMEDGRSVEIATVGSEGFVGIPAFLQGSFVNTHAAFCQVPGETLAAEVGPFLEIVNHSSPLHALLHRYTLALLGQIAQSAACNRLHTMEQRCVRWILMTHDRVHRDEFPLSQEFLAQMLGVRRATVNEAVRPLHAAGLVAYRRGTMTIADRPGLERHACECYRVIRDEQARLVD